MNKNIFYFLCVAFFSFELLALPQFYSLQPVQASVAHDPSHYFLISFAKNESVYTSRQAFNSGKWHPGLGYHYVMNDWHVGLSMDVRSFKEKTTGKEVPLFAFSQDSFYKIRLYHPFYLLTGGSLHYLYPLKEAGFPIVKETLYRTEMGVGLSLGLLYRLSNILSFHGFLEGWRGIQTTNFFGIKMTLGISFSF